MKLSLSTDFGSPEHWERVIEFAHGHGVARLVFWGNYSQTGFAPPFLYPNYPGLLPDEQRTGIERLRECLRRAAEMTKQAGMEFWYVYQVLQVPDRAVSTWPELFSLDAEPDMGGELVYQFLRDQQDELFALVPNLDGVELWVMECASVVIAALQHQQLSTEEICGRVVDTVYDSLSARGCRMTQDLHTAGGNTVTLQGLFQAAARHPDIILSGDNVIGDYHLHLPFNAHLVRAAKTNPVQVNFDLDGEYWGRNLVPTSALSQYAAHLEEARHLEAVYVNGRVSTGHDIWSPHANVLPSRRRFYPALAQITDDTPLPPDLEVTCTHTLGAFNAEFFCRRVQEPDAQPEETVRDFLQREFGDEATALVPTFMKLENTLGKIFFADGNYFVVQSVSMGPELAQQFALDAQLACSPGTAFPPPELQKREGGLMAFAGWPTPLGHRCAGAEAMIRDKEEGLRDAQSLLAEVRTAAGLKPEDRDFLIRQFEDLVFFARAFRLLLEAQAHHFLMQAGKRAGSLPSPVRLQKLLGQMREVAAAWQARYPGGRYGTTKFLRYWAQIIETASAGQGLEKIEP